MWRRGIVSIYIPQASHPGRIYKGEIYSYRLVVSPDIIPFPSVHLMSLFQRQSTDNLKLKLLCARTYMGRRPLSLEFCPRSDAFDRRAGRYGFVSLLRSPVCKGTDCGSSY